MTEAGARFALAVLASACLVGCSPPGSGDVLVRDSAGIRIVENGPGTLGSAESWTVEETPRTSIGGGDDGSPYRLAGVSDAVVLEDGRVVVLDGAARQLRLYDGTGAFLTAHGRGGRGAGEYGRPVAVWRVSGDSVAVLDAELRRVTVLSHRLALGRVSPVAGQAPLVVQDGASGDRLLVAAAAEGGAGGDGVVPVTLRLLGLDGAADSLLSVPGFERVGGAWPIYGWSTRSAVSGDRLVVGTGRSHEVAEYDAAGGGPTLRRLIRWPGERPAVTEGERQEYIAGYAARSARDSAEVEGLRRSLEEVAVAERAPAYGDIRLDAAGNLWVGDYVPAWRAVPPPRGWTVFDDEGRLIARASLPAGLRLLEIGEDRILAVRTDSAGTQRVEVLAIRRDGGR